MTLSTKYKCIECSTQVHRKETKYCRNCYNSHRPKRVSLDEKLERQKKYKALYHQKNKEAIKLRISKRRLENPEKTKQQTFKYYLKNKFGISIETYNKILIKQDYKCAICGYKQPEIASGYDKLYIDHNHVTGNIRGLLCMSCNSAIGHLKEDLTFLKNAITYLENEKHSDNTTNS